VDDEGAPVHPYETSAPRSAKMDLIIEPEDDDDDLPIGDAVLPLSLMAAMLGVWRTWRRRREIMA